jgi:PPOX class probable F420-dependent enzyme
VLTNPVRRFLDCHLVGHLATADSRAIPHVVPICFAISDATVYSTIDEKPKRNPSAPLQRIRNIAENPVVAVVVDRYDDDWAKLGWVMLRGPAEILCDGPEHDSAQALLRARYRQLAAMNIRTLPVIALRIESVVTWGDLTTAHRICRTWSQS